MKKTIKIALLLAFLTTSRLILAMEQDMPNNSDNDEPKISEEYKHISKKQKLEEQIEKICLTDKINPESKDSETKYSHLYNAPSEIIAYIISLIGENEDQAYLDCQGLVQSNKKLQEITIDTLYEKFKSNHAKLSKLHVALELGAINWVHENLQSYAHELTVQNNKGQTPLMLAIEKNYHNTAIQIINLMDKNGINLEDNNGFTAIFYAFINQNHEIIELLLKKKASERLQLKNLPSNDVLGAQERHHLETGRIDKPKFRIFPLCAIQTGDKKTVYLWLESLDTKKNFDKLIITGLLPFAVRYQNSEILKILLDKLTIKIVTDPELKNKLNQALIYAARNNNAKIVKLLLDAGADSNPIGYHEIRPLMWAAYFKNEEMVRDLLNVGAIVSFKDVDGKTSLDWAYKRLNPDNNTVDTSLDIIIGLLMLHE